MMQSNTAADDGRWCYAISDKNLWVSSDFGVTWTDFGLLGTGSVLNANPSGIGVAVGSCKVYTAGPGLTKTAIQTVPSSRRALSLCASSGSNTPSYIFFGTNPDANTAVLYREQGTGAPAAVGTFQTWDGVPESGSCCSDDGKYGLIGGAAGFSNCFRTTNFGASWAETLGTQSYGTGPTDTCMSADGKYQFVVNSTKFCFSSDYGANWTAINRPFAANCCCMSADGSKIFAGGSGGIRVASAGNWQSWTSLNSALTSIQSISCNMSGDRLIACVSNAIWYSQDAGVNWAKAKDGLFVDVAMCRGNVPLGGGIVIPQPQVSVDMPGWGGGSSVETINGNQYYRYYSYDIGDSESTSMTATNNGPAFTAYIRNSSEYNYDYVTVTCNGSQIASGYGNNNGYVAFTFPANSTCTITYRKDSSASSGDDTGYFYLPVDVRTAVVHETIPRRAYLSTYNGWSSAGNSGGYTYYHSTIQGQASTSAELKIVCEQTTTNFQFAVRTNGESNYDYLVVYDWNGNTLWNGYGKSGQDYETITVPTFTAGQMIRLVYSKDSSVDSGDDEGCLRILTSLITTTTIQ